MKREGRVTGKSKGGSGSASRRSWVERRGAGDGWWRRARWRGGKERAPYHVGKREGGIGD